MFYLHGVQKQFSRRRSLLWQSILLKIVTLPVEPVKKVTFIIHSNVNWHEMSTDTDQLISLTLCVVSSVPGYRKVSSQVCRCEAHSCIRNM